jgi:hypothetical protein
MDIAGESARPPPVVGQQSLRRGPRLAYAQRPVLDTTLRTVARRPIAVDVPVRKIHLKTLTAATYARRRAIRSRCVIDNAHIAGFALRSIQALMSVGTRNDDLF